MPAAMMIARALVEPVLPFELGVGKLEEPVSMGSYFDVSEGRSVLIEEYRMEVHFSLMEEIANPLKFAA
jgi:hypothetical protein